MQALPVEAADPPECITHAFANNKDASHCLAGALLGPGAAAGEPTGESVRASSARGL